MANDKHVKILKKGTDAWNKWRRQNYFDVTPDLRGAELRGAKLNCAMLNNLDLSDVDLSDASLIEADFTDSVLHRVHLTSADLSGATFERADFSDASLNQATLISADLSRAVLVRADLSEANLNRAILVNTDLTQANLSHAELLDAHFSDGKIANAIFFEVDMAFTTIANLDLSEVKQLESVKHNGPSSIGIDTIYKSGGNIPEVFLRRCGVPENFVTYMRSLTQNAIEYYSCFISYSSKDEDFAKRLYLDLQSEGVRCWFAPEALKIGDKFRARIDESIRLHDKLLLVLSERSVASQWVEKEVETAFEKETEQKRVTLFPLRLDNEVMRIKVGWAADIRRSRHIADFSDWKNHDSYKKAFKKLVQDLEPEEPNS